MNTLAMRLIKPSAPGPAPYIMHLFPLKVEFEASVFAFPFLSASVAGFRSFEAFPSGGHVAWLAAFAVDVNAPGCCRP